MTAKTERAAMEWAKSAEAYITALEDAHRETLAGSFTVPVVLAVSAMRARLQSARALARSAGINPDGDPLPRVTRAPAPVSQQIAGGA